MTAPADQEKQDATPAESREADTGRLLSTLGLCARARRLVIGTPMVCEAMRQNRQILCVLAASDTSGNTHNKLTSKCAWYKVPLHRLCADSVSLGRSVGKHGPVAAVGITDKDMLRALEKYFPSAEAPGLESSQIIN